jgi:hypothetical protein
MRLRRSYLIVAMLAFATPLIYAGITHHVWEDYLITFRFSENLANGNGLVYNIPERVHGFTSPIGVLLPALLHLLSGRHSWVLTIWLFRIVSAIAFSGAVTLLYDAVLRSSRSTLFPPNRRGATPAVSAVEPHRQSSRYLLPAVAVVALMLLEPKSVAFSANGQESAFMLLGVAAAIRLSLEAPSKKWKGWAAVGALLQWTRPEGFLYCLVFALANWIFNLESRRAVAIAFLKAAAVAILLYLPWVIFTTIYYGSPIPHTIIAKATLPGVHNNIASLVANIPVRATAALACFSDWPAHVAIVAAAVAWWALLYWLIPASDRVGRIASVCFLLLSPYFAYLSMDYAWYYPPFAACAIVALASGLPAVVRKFAPQAQLLAACILAGIVVERGAFAVEFTRTMKAQQAIIEDSNRMQIGLYLRDRVRPGETVMLECLGYIGYFSNAHMLEWPGLVSPQVTKLTRQRLPISSIIATLRPDWVVLRLHESDIVRQDPRFDQMYSLDRTFDVSDKVAAVQEDIQAVRYLVGDSFFYVYHRKV